MKRKPKTRDELFKRILRMWRDDEKQILSEWGVGNHSKLREDLMNDYDEYLKLWEELK